MPDSKITALTALTAADPAVDMFPVVDVSDTTMAASGTTKRISINNILACSPAATLASLNVTGSSIPANGLYLPTTNTLEFAANSLAQYRIAPLGVFSWYDGAGGTRMTLNATGLGVGQSPTAPLHIYSAATGTGPITNVVGTFRTGAAGRDVSLQFSDTANQAYVTMLSGALLFGTGGATERVRIDTVGNLLIGLTAAGTTAAKTIQIANGTAPTANVTGGQLYVEAGALKYRGSSGTVTTIANA